MDASKMKCAADDISERPVGGLLHGIVDDPQLVAKLSTRSGLVHRAQHPLPETPPDRQDRVVLDEQLTVARGEGDLRARQLPFNFAAVILQHLLDRRLGGRLFLENHFAGDLLNVGVLQLDGDREVALELLEKRHSGQGILPGRNDHDRCPELGT